MRKLFFVFFILLPFLSNAQLFEGGIDFGLAVSQIDGDDFGGYNQPGVSFMVYSSLGLSKTLSLTSGVGYVKKGAHSKIKQEFFSTCLHYAEIPLVLNIVPFGKLSFSVGPVFGYLFSGYQKTNFGDFDQDYLNLRSSEFSYHFSVNYILSKRLSVRFVDNYSLMPITKPFSRSCLRNNVFLYFFFRNAPVSACWWNNNVRITFQYKIFWSGKNE